LDRAGYRVVVYDNLSRGHRWAVRWGLLEEGDLLDQARLQSVLAKHRIEAVLHFAGLIAVGESMRAPELYFRANVGGTLSLLDAMRAAGVRRLVFSSTAAVYGDPEALPIEEGNATAPSSPYGETKLMVERILHWEAVCHGLRWMALRYFNAAGCDADGEIGEAHDPETHLIPLLLDAALGSRGPCPIYGTDYPTPDGTCIRDYVHVTDLAGAHVRALQYLEAGGESAALNLGTGHGYSVREILAVAQTVTGLRIPVEEQPRRSGDTPRLVASAERARKALGWKPALSLEEILSTAWQWQQQWRSSQARAGGVNSRIYTR
jgi:UDP-glucose-4-epimerase GalE